MCECPCTHNAVTLSCTKTEEFSTKCPSSYTAYPLSLDMGPPISACTHACQSSWIFTVASSPRPRSRHLARQTANAAGKQLPEPLLKTYMSACRSPRRVRFLTAQGWGGGMLRKLLSPSRLPLTSPPEIKGDVHPQLLGNP